MPGWSVQESARRICSRLLKFTLLTQSRISVCAVLVSWQGRVFIVRSNFVDLGSRIHLCGVRSKMLRGL